MCPVGWSFCVLVLVFYSVLASIRKMPIAISAMLAAMKMLEKGATMLPGGLVYVT